MTRLGVPGIYSLNGGTKEGGISGSGEVFLTGEMELDTVDVFVDVITISKAGF